MKGYLFISAKVRTKRIGLADYGIRIKGILSFGVLGNIITESMFAEVFTSEDMKYESNQRVYYCQPSTQTLKIQSYNVIANWRQCKN